MPSPSAPAATMVSTPRIATMLLQSPGSRLAEPSSHTPSILPPLPPDYPLVARSSSPRHHVSAPSPSSTSRRTSRSGNPPALTTSPSTPTRRRRQHSPCLRSLRRSITVTASGNLSNAPVQWGEDTIANHALSNIDPNHLGAGGEDEDFLSTFAEHDFSSPSTYPSFTANLPPGEASQSDQAAFQPQLATHSAPGSAAVSSRRSSACNRLFAAPSRSTTQLSSSTVGESQFTHYSNEEWDEPLSQSSNGSFSDMMPPPPTRLHHLVDGFDDASSINKRQHTLASDIAVNNATVEPLQLPSVPDDDLFGDSLVPRESDLGNGRQEMTTIDLTEANEVPEDLKKPDVPEADNRTKISKFQCVICMDDASTLTVTHCGHLYCAQCLHSSLHVEATKGKCPMCRAKIDMKSRSAYNTKTKGFWPLELKLMTATRKGKRKAEDIS